MEKQVFNNFICFRYFKNPGYPLFKRINATEVNEHLNNMMPGLTTHTFRTMKASSMFEREHEHGAARGSEPQELLDSYEEANWVVAKLCNHQKTSRTMAEGATSLEVLQAKMAELKRELSEAQMDADTREDRAFTTRRVKSCRKRMRAAEKVFESADVATKEAAKEKPDFSLRTSRLHYVDPWITVSWCRAHQVPIERVRPD